jgi:isoleucyl-tRNA synthetase
MQYITETEGIISKKIKPNYKTLGSKLGAQMKEAAAAIGKLGQPQIADLEKNGSMALVLSGGSVEITTADVEIVAEDIPGWSVASKGNLTVALDITITDDLKKEGDAREFVNRVQNIRKENGFDLTDRIFVQVQDVPELKDSLNHYKNYICAEILADSLEWTPELTGKATEIEVNDVLLKVSVTKKG